MFDYYDYVHGLPEAKLVLEMEKLNKRLFKTSQTSPVFQQLMNMIDMAQSAYTDKQYAIKIKKEDQVMNIGDISSEEYTPDYTRDEIVNAYIEVYTKNTPRKPQR